MLIKTGHTYTKCKSAESFRLIRNYMVYISWIFNFWSQAVIHIPAGKWKICFFVKDSMSSRKCVLLFMENALFIGFILTIKPNCDNIRGTKISFDRASLTINSHLCAFEILLNIHRRMQSLCYFLFINTTESILTVISGIGLWLDLTRSNVINIHLICCWIFIVECNT